MKKKRKENSFGNRDKELKRQQLKRKRNREKRKKNKKTLKK